MDKNEKLEKIKALGVDFVSILESLIATKKRIEALNEQYSPSRTNPDLISAYQNCEKTSQLVFNFFTEVVAEIFE